MTFTIGRCSYKVWRFQLCVCRLESYSSPIDDEQSFIDSAFSLGPEQVVTIETAATDLVVHQMRHRYTLVQYF